MLKYIRIKDFKKIACVTYYTGQKANPIYPGGYEALKKEIKVPIAVGQKLRQKLAAEGCIFKGREYPSGVIYSGEFQEPKYTGMSLRALITELKNSK